ncbi:MAG: VPLPA-CTERM-specific exosortase XrtD [Gammaproteobacteria bacterium]
METADNKQAIDQLPINVLVMVLVTFALLTFTFYDGLSSMVGSWSTEEYSHGYLIPFVSLYLIWRKHNALSSMVFKASWGGFVVVLSGLLLYFVGELSALFVLVQYAFLVTLYGIALTLLGWQGMRAVWFPLVYLIFMIPLPNFLYFNLSSELQLISSSLGVAVIRWFGISVFLEGNVIDLGSYQLQVIEACSGLRYLFPLMSFGFLCAYLFKAPFWQRATIFLSTIPITIVMNSFRIGVIGVLVEYKGIEMAEGFLHDLEGWVIFMGCVAILFAEMWIFVRLFTKKRLLDVFGLFNETSVNLTSLNTEMQIQKKQVVSHSFIASIGLLVIAAVTSSFIDERQELIPARSAFATFPMQIDDWVGRDQGMDTIFIDALKFDDYVMANYRHPEQESIVNFYVAYYESQRKGASVHSPRSCIPGGGWRITELTQHTVNAKDAHGSALTVNRVLIEKGDSRQLVYYWFPQRGRDLTNEYIVKWYLFWDSMTRNRSDGALVRLTTPVSDITAVEKADARLEAMLAAVRPHLDKYIPN